MTTSTLLINTDQFKGMDMDTMVEFIAPNRKITAGALITDITALGGTAPTNTSKRELSTIYAGLVIAKRTMDEVTTMVKEIGTLSKEMKYPTSHIAERVNVKWSNNPTMEEAQAVLDMARKVRTQRMKKLNEIQALGGTADITMTHKELIELASELKIALEDKQSANGETPKAEQKQEKVESQMTQGITQEQFNAGLAQLSQIFNQTLVDAMSTQSLQMAEIAQDVADTKQRIANVESGATAQVTATVEQPKESESKTLSDAINAHYGYVVCHEATPIEFLRNMMSVVEKESKQPQQATAPNQPKVDVDPDAIVYTPGQISQLEALKANGKMELHNKLKESFDRLNKTMGRTAGNFLNNTAAFIDTTGHKGVDGVADFLDNTIDVAKNLIIKLTEFTADASHSVIGVGRNAGHVIINGVVYTIERTANFTNKQ